MAEGFSIELVGWVIYINRLSQYVLCVMVLLLFRVYIYMHTAVHKVIDLLFGHSGAFGGTERAFLLLAPFVDETRVFRIAAIS